MNEDERTGAMKIIFEIIEYYKNAKMPLKECVESIAKIATTLTKDEVKIEAIDSLCEIVLDRIVDEEILDSCLEHIGEIAKTLKDKINKIKVINKLLTMANDKRVDERRRLISCPKVIGEITQTFSDEMESIESLCEIVLNGTASELTLYICAKVIEKNAETLENSDLQKIVEETITIIEDMQKSMQPLQTIQDMPEEIQTQFFKKIQTKITEIEEIREEVKIFAAGAAMTKLYTDAEQETSTSAAAVAAAGASVDTPKTPMKEPENLSVIGTHTANLAAKKAMISDGNPTPTIK